MKQNLEYQMDHLIGVIYHSSRISFHLTILFLENHLHSQSFTSPDTMQKQCLAGFDCKLVEHDCTHLH